jgi:hypothetical protein
MLAKISQNLSDHEKYLNKLNITQEQQSSTSYKKKRTIAGLMYIQQTWRS